MAVEKAARTLRHMRWFEVEEIRGYIDGNSVAHWRVTMKVGFTME